MKRVLYQMNFKSQARRASSSRPEETGTYEVAMVQGEGVVVEKLEDQMCLWKRARETTFFIEYLEHCIFSI